MTRVTEIIARLENALAKSAEERLDAVSNEIRNDDQRRKAAYRIGIITALSKETAAARAVFLDKGTIPSPARAAVQFIELECPIKSEPRQSHKLVLCQCLRMGNNSAAVAAATLLAEFPGITDLIMMGIAGGVPNVRIPNEHVRRGDVVVSDEAVLQYDMLKMEIDRNENRSKAPQPSGRVLNALNQWEQTQYAHDYSWEKYIDKGLKSLRLKRPHADSLYEFRISAAGIPSRLGKRLKHPKQTDRRNARPMVHRGVIGSANILLKNAKIREHLTTLKVRAVEMEGSGVADAAWSFAVGYMVVRGICDYCDMKKDNKWQLYAATAAAAFCRALVEQVPVATTIQNPDRTAVG